MQLSTTLQGVVTSNCSRPRTDRGRVAAEVMVATPAVRNLIREGKVHQIYSAMQAGGRYGMQTMDQSLCRGSLSRVARHGCHDVEDRPGWSWRRPTAATASADGNDGGRTVDA